MTPERLAECKQICACVPFIDKDAGVTETMAAMRDLISQVERDAEDIETMQAGLDRLVNATIGPAILSNICEAGQDEIRSRSELADEIRKNTHAWKEAMKETAQ